MIFLHLTYHTVHDCLEAPKPYHGENLLALQSPPLQTIIPSTIKNHYSMAWDQCVHTNMTSIYQIVRNNTPITINVETFSDISRDANKEMNGIMDPLQKMGRSLFLLTKNSKISQWIRICLWRTIVFQCINDCNG